MKYRYTSAWRMQGGWNYPSQPTTRELVNHADRRLVLTTDPANFLRAFDRRMLVANHLLGGGPFRNADGWDNAAIARELSRVAIERRDEVASAWFVVVVVDGVLDGKALDFEEAVVIDDDAFGWDLFDAQGLKKAHERDVDALMTVLSTSFEWTPRFDKLGDSIVGLSDDGRQAQSLSATAFGDLSVSCALPNDDNLDIQARARALLDDTKLAAVARLSRRTVDGSSDPLLRFLHAWCALEILVGKASARVDRAALPAEIPALQLLVELERQEPNHNPRSIRRQFLLITAWLFPVWSREEVETHLKSFDSVRKVRNELFHGQDVNERTLPTGPVFDLLRRYLSMTLSRSP